MEILGLERCFQFLKPDGRLAIVLQDGVLTDSSHDHVRKWLHTQGELIAIISLPEHTFTPYGASPKTSLVFFRKYKKGERPNIGLHKFSGDDSKKQKPVFFGRIDDIGYDATGRDKGKSEVPEMIKQFHEKKGW